MHNEEENVGPMVDRLCQVAQGLKGWRLTVLFVDDGSKDSSVARVREMHDRGLPAGYVKLSRNFGHQAAILAGLMMAEGDVIITMDADLQHPPEAIPAMLEAADKGADVVQMVRSASQEGSKGLLSVWFYRVFNRISETKLTPDAPDFRLMSRRVIEVLRQIPEREKFLRGLVPMLGFNQITMPYDQSDRIAGRPSYSLFHSMRLARKALFDFSTIPLRLVFWAGTSIAILSFLAGIGFVIEKLVRWQKVTPGFADMIVSILFLSGCTLMSIGILGRYLMMVLDQVRGRPAFVVMEHCRPCDSADRATHT
jgi:dolichol-phosphate mannosyltransferase